jgi:HK97 family phage portal protein
VSFLDRLQASTEPDPRSVISDRCWSSTTPAYGSSSGIVATPDLSMQVSCVVLGGRIYGETLSTLPLILYREGEEGKEKAKDHYLWNVLRRKANPWQTAQQWRELMIVFAVYWGVGMSEIRISRTGEVWLLPIHPDWIVKREQLAGSLKIRFTIQEPGQQPRVLLQDEVFRLEGFGIHSLFPSILLSLARETVGAWIAKGRFGALYFARGANPSVWLQFPKMIQPDQYNKLKEQVNVQYGGFANHHRALIVDGGATVKEVSHNAKDSQLNEAMDADVHDFARWFNLPVQIFQPVSQTATFASAEQFNQNMVDYSFRPWAIRFEQALARDLFPDEEDLYAEHLFDGLMRGNTVERANAQRTWVEAGILTRNEARAAENRPPLPGLHEPLTPLNMDRTTGPPSTPAPAAPAPKPKKKKEALSGSSAAPRRLCLIAKGAAQRVVRKELATVRDKGSKYAAASNQDAWRQWLNDFYGAAHQAFVTESLQIESMVAAEYCARHRDAILEGGLSAAERWDVEAVNELLKLAEVPSEEPIHV